MLELYYDKKEYSKVILKKDLKVMIKTIAAELEMKPNFSISIIDSTRMVEINNEYRNKNENTDIITFSDLDGMPFPVNGQIYYGDVFINLDKMNENAKMMNVSEKEELLRLVIHGLLHLKGYDHKTNDFEKEDMLILQETIVNKYKNILKY